MDTNSDQLLKDTLYKSEEWKSIKGFEGRYLISNYGRVWSLISNRQLSASENSHGYLYVGLIDKWGLRYTIATHRLVAESFIPNPAKWKHVHHKDSVKNNNHIDNLEWISESEHACITYRNKVKELQKLHRNTHIVQCDRFTLNLIKIWRNEDNNLYGKNGEFFYLPHIHACCGNLIQSHRGYQWFYIDDYPRYFPNINIEIE